MNFVLSNKHRKCMGLKLAQDDWELVKYKNKNGTLESYLYFSGDTIKKIVNYMIYEESLSMLEMDVDYKTKNNRTILIPKTNKGKEKKITKSVIDTLNGTGNYFYIVCDKINGFNEAIIGNFTTQKHFYNDMNFSGTTFEDFKEWCDEYANGCSKEDILEVQNFSKENRKHVKYQEGDYFKIKYNKNNYLYGRIIMDIRKRIKQGMPYFDIFMGVPLIIEIFHIYTKRKNVTINELKNLKTFPPQYIMDNNLYFGDWEIIGHDEIPNDIQYPIMYGKDDDHIIFQCGEIQKTIPYSEDKLICSEIKDCYGDRYRFENNDIAKNLFLDENTIKECINNKSNIPYWENYKEVSYEDLRAPINRKYLIKILKQFNLEYLLEIYK